MINSVLHTNQHSIDRLLKAGVPVMLYFWRTDAPISTAQNQVLDALALDYSGRVLIAKIDAATETELVSRYNIKLVPSIVMVQNGNTLATLAGRVSDDTLRGWAAHLVEGAPRPSAVSGEGVPAVTGQPMPVNGTSHKSAGQHATVRPDQTDSNQPIVLTDANFDQIIKSDKPVLVDFWAAWCGPCRMVEPSVKTLAAEFAGRAVVGKLNVDENRAIAQRYQIMSIPALYIFRDGQIVDKIVGAQPLPVLRSHLAQAVK